MLDRFDRRAYMALMLRCSKTARVAGVLRRTRAHPERAISGHPQEITDMANKPKIIEATTAGIVDEAANTTAAIEDQMGNVAGKGFETTVLGLKEGMAKAAAGLADTQAKVKEGMEKAMKTAEEFVAFSQGNVEALVKSGQIWTAGVQDIGKQIAANAQASFEETMSTFKALSSAKSVKDAFDLQASLARSTMEKAMAESGKLTDASLKLTEQVMAPITARFSLAMEKFAKSA
jgi:phasin family protein